MRIRVLAAAAVVALIASACGADADPEPTDDPTSAGTEGPDRSGTVERAWDVDAEEEPVSFSPADEGATIVPAGERVVVVGDEQVTAHDATSGDAAWTVDLPGPVCAGSPSAAPDGLVVVVVAPEGADTCTEAVAIDTNAGEVRWTAEVPRAGDALGLEVSVGPDGVVVTGECAGFSVLGLADGAVASSVAGTTVGGRCPSAASDGTTVVLGWPDRITVHDVATGERRGSWPADGLGRVGDVVSSDPLVVTAAFASGRHLVDLSGSAPRVFGPDEGGFGGEPATSAVVGDTLWLQYDDVQELIGFDLVTRAEVGRVPAGLDATLVGAHDGRLVVTLGGDSPDGVSLELVDPAAPDAPEVVGVLPWPALQEDGSLAGSAVVGDHLVRLWHGRLEAFDLP